MRSKGSRFTLGVWGLRVCSLDVGFVVATVRNRSCEDRMAVPMGSSAGGIIFGGFRRLVASFRLAGVALRDIQRRSVTCRKSFCVAGAILLRRFAKMRGRFRGRRSAFDVSIVIFRGRRSTLDVSCCVFFVNRIGRAASSGDKVQIPWQSWHFARCAENWRKPRTKHRFWGCKFSCSKENSSENVDFEATKCENWRTSRTKCSFWCFHLSRLASLVLWWFRRVYGGSCKTCLFGMFQSVKIGGRLARNAHCGAPTCLVSSRWFSCGVAVSMGEAGKPLLLECVQAGCHVVLRGRRGALWHSKLFDNVLKMSKLEEVSSEMLVFLYHASRLESLVFLWRRRVYGGSRKISPFRRFPSRLSCRFAWQAWHFVTFQPVW